jgi:glycosyltransferase involved in cell wall biosynthesis
MALIVIADDGVRFDGGSLEAGPLGGAETAVVSLAEALARRGHQVFVRNKCEAPVRHRGVDWAPLEHGLPEAADLYIANRGDRLLPLVPRARRRVFWIHNPAGYLLKWRYLAKLWRWRPVIVFSGPYHARTYPRWAPDGGRVVIPYGIADVFRWSEAVDEPPPPRAVFTSSPLRSLDWLMRLWAERIHPRLPEAELHLFSGPQTYGELGAAKADKMQPVLQRARGLADRGIVLRVPVGKSVLAEELRAARVLLYRGDVGETFCLAVGEAQAVGLPCVVENIGCVAERVIDGETGVVARDDEAFAEAAVRLLSDNRLWQRQHAAARDRQRGWGWDEAAAAFERLLP